MKGLLILSEMRNGSTWVASLTNGTGLFGNADEWLNPDNEPAVRATTADAHLQDVIRAGSTENGVFAAKIFPWQLRRCREEYGYDFVSRCRETGDLLVVLLERRDLLGAAISAERALQSGKWSSLWKVPVPVKGNGGAPRYDRDAIYQHMITIADGLAFWRKYIALHGIEHVSIAYEDVVADRKPYLEMVSRKLRIPCDRELASTDLTSVQRDALSGDWRRRFLEEMAQVEIDRLLLAGDIYPRTARNALRLLRKRPLHRREEP